MTKIDFQNIPQEVPFETSKELNDFQRKHFGKLYNLLGLIPQGYIEHNIDESWFIRGQRGPLNKMNDLQIFECIEKDINENMLYNIEELDVKYCFASLVYLTMSSDERRNVKFYSDNEGKTRPKKIIKEILHVNDHRISTDNIIKFLLHKRWIGCTYSQFKDQLRLRIKIVMMYYINTIEKNESSKNTDKMRDITVSMIHGGNNPYFVDDEKNSIINVYSSNRSMELKNPEWTFQYKKVNNTITADV